MPGSRLTRAVGLTLGLLLLPCTNGCGRPARPPNVLILSIDSLRADHLGSYGYRRDTSPHIDRFAQGSIRFASAMAPAPWTLPSHVALLSGRHPHEIGVRSHESSIPPEVELLAETLDGAGYQTAAFVDSLPGGFVGAQRGFRRGFDTYTHTPPGLGSIHRYDMAVTVDAAAGWLGQRDPTRPFFLFLHTKSVHVARRTPALEAVSDAPYHTPGGTRFLGPEPRFSWTDGTGATGARYLRALNERIAAGTFDRSDFGTEKLEELVALYDSGIHYVDEQVGRLIATLDDLRLDESTLIVVTADHGEAFLEHDLFLHREVHRPLLHVPLILRDPRVQGAGGRVVSAPVALADVAPTVLDRVGLPLPAAMTARPLPLTDGEAGPPRPLFSAFQYGDDYYYRAASLQDGSFKLVCHWLGRNGKLVVTLFDTAADPEERHPLGPSERREEMLSRLLGWLEAPAGASGDQLQLDSETLDELRALGYIR